MKTVVCVCVCVSHSQNMLTTHRRLRERWRAAWTSKTVSLDETAGGNGTYVVAASSQRPLVQHICSDFLRAPGRRGSDTGCSQESANCKCA